MAEAGPRPGRMPTSVPSRQPISAKPMLASVSALARPESRPTSMSGSPVAACAGCLRVPRILRVTARIANTGERSGATRQRMQGCPA